MNQEEPVVYVVDDDPSLRGAIDSLLRSAGWRVQTFVSARDFLDAKPRPQHACLILDIRLPDVSGLDLQGELIKGTSSSRLFSSQVTPTSRCLSAR